MSYRFTVPHSLPERTRIRWAGDKTERAAIHDLAVRIESLAGVTRSEPRLATGSIIIEHDGIDWESLEIRLRRELAIEIQPAVPVRVRTGLETFNDNVNRLDDRLGKINLDLNSMSFLFLMLMAVAQAVQGRVGASSVSFLWYAMSLAARMRANSGDNRSEELTPT